MFWLLAAGSVVYWALKFVGGTSAPAYATVVGAAPGAQAGAVDSTAVARALGGGFAPNSVAASATPTLATGITASRFVLTGVIDGSGGSKDLALIAIDAKPARPYRVGGVLEHGVVLQSVAQRKAVIGPQDAGGGAGVTLELPPRPVFVGVAGAAAVTPLAPPAPTTPPPVASVALPPPVVIQPSPTASQSLATAAASAAVDAAAMAAARAGGANGQMQGRFGANRQKAAGGAAGASQSATSETGEILLAPQQSQ